MTTYRYFSPNELKCPCCGESEMNLEFMARLEALREKCGFPFIVTSAYRCPAYNNKISGTGLDGPHTTGKAIDIAVMGLNAYKIIHLAAKYGIHGLGISQKGDYNSRFIHLDSLPADSYPPRPWVWSY